MDKTAVRDRMLALEEHELQNSKDAYLEFVAATCVVDRGELVEPQASSQAVQSRNLAEALDSPFHDHLAKLEALKKIDFGPKSKVEEGAIVEFDGRCFVISVATLAFCCEGHELMGISMLAPIYEELADRRAGETFVFRGHKHVIQTII